MRRIAIFTLLTAVADAPSYADFYNGHKLKELVDAQARFDAGTHTSIDQTKVSQLQGYVTGVHDSFEDRAICAPRNATVNQLIAVVAKFIRNNPSRWNEDGSKLVVEALAQAFPCSSK